MTVLEQHIVPYEAVTRIGVGPVLVLAPHPDDEVFGCAGAILSHLSAGDVVRVIIATDGAYGSRKEELESARAMRERESQCAADTLGYGTPVFWRLPDRGLHSSESLVKKVSDAIHDMDAQLIYAPSINEVHPDHYVLGMAAAQAVWRQGPDTRLVMYEIGSPLHPNRLLDISEVVDIKKKAMNCFRSQLDKQNYDDHIAALNRFRTYTLSRDIKAAEAYFVISAGELRADPLSFYALDRAAGRRRAATEIKSEYPLVSVIIRSIDRPQINEALQSVAMQTYPNIEVLIVNAVGPGHSEIEDHCGRFPVRAVGGEEPLARSRAANLGLDQSAGKYLVFLDDDDIFLPDHVACLVKALEDNPDARAAYSGIREETHFKDGSEGPVVIRSEPFDSSKLFAENFIPMHAVMFERSLIDDGVRFDETLEFYEDWDVWVQMAQLTNFCHVDHVTACYRNNGSCGFGLEPDVALETRAKAEFFEKWRHQWSGEQLRDVIGTLSQEVRQSNARMRELRNKMMAQESQLERIRSSRLWKIASRLNRMARRFRSGPVRPRGA